MEKFKTVKSSELVMSELMLPSHSNFSGKIHGGYILKLLDQIAFACASKHSGSYCVTASVDTVDFLAPIEIGELVSMKASVNYVGRSSIIVGIRVEAENIQTGKVKHCNSSYFTMVAKNSEGKGVQVPGLIIKNYNEVKRFYKSLKRIALRKEHNHHKQNFDYKTDKALQNLKGYNVQLDIDTNTTTFY